MGTSRAALVTADGRETDGRDADCVDPFFSLA
jgi:hypothetical protein